MLGNKLIKVLKLEQGLQHQGCLINIFYIYTYVVIHITERFVRL